MRLLPARMSRDASQVSISDQPPAHSIVHASVINVEVGTRTVIRLTKKRFKVLNKRVKRPDRRDNPNTCLEERNVHVLNRDFLKVNKRRSHLSVPYRAACSGDGNGPGIYR